MGPELPFMQAAWLGLGWTLLLGSATWLASLARSDVSLVDRVWSVLIAGAAVAYAVASANASPNAAAPASPGPRTLWLLALVIAWALRLAAYVTRRNWGHGEDRRYQQIRARNQPHFALKSLYLIFALQAVLAWVVSWPFLIAIAAGGNAAAPALGVLDGLGLALAAFGIVFEAVGDAQMATFKADPSHRGQVMDRGLWRYTRHPNYFGETCIWWGFWLVAIGAAGLPGAWWGAASPIVMTVLLLKVSGVSLLEKDITERRPAYREYILRTNAFFPGAPRKEAR